MTIEYLIHQAQERPQAIALIEGDREICYADFTRDLWRFTRAVQAFKVPRGGSVAIGCDDFYTHWLLILAFERLGIATSSFDSNEGGMGHGCCWDRSTWFWPSRIFRWASGRPVRSPRTGCSRCWPARMTGRWRRCPSIRMM